jgi:hypothetical protein
MSEKKAKALKKRIKEQYDKIAYKDMPFDVVYNTIRRGIKKGTIRETN